MRGHKWDGVKLVALTLPFLLLIAYVLGLPLPLPAFLLPERAYLAFGAGTGAAALREARGSAREAFVLLPDRLLPLPRRGSPASAYEKAAALLPEEALLTPLFGDIAAGSSRFRRARLVAGFHPGVEELASLQAAAIAAALSLSLEIEAPVAEFPLMSLSYRRNSADKRLAFELLYAPTARAASRIEVDALYASKSETAGSRTGRLRLWAGAGTELPQDLVLRLSVDRAGLAAIELGLVSPDGKRISRQLELGADLDEEPRVLIVSQKTGASSFIESLYPSKRVDQASAASEDLHAYELVVVDGLPLRGIDGALKTGILELAARRTGSLFFAADSPDFGTKGDNPELEALLPVNLLPRSLKDLPDLALLILIDTSGSMFGDKLSLAKVTGLELLRSLKPSDLVGMMLFSDERSWAYDFLLNKNISAAPLLEPLSAGGGTELAPALAEGLERLGAQGLKDKHLVIISDGVTKPADFQALADRARRLGISISTMGIGEDLNRALLERLALQAGGRFYRVNSAEEIPALLFEDRKSAARPAFAQGSIPVLALSGERVATIGGMAQYAVAEPSTVLFTNDLGDPLFASRERGNRAVMLFASDLYGGYSSDFFSRSATAGAVKDRLDALFAKRPLELAISEGARGALVLLRSDALAAPSLLLSRPGQRSLEIPFRRTGPELWSTRALAPLHGSWRASILDRGSSLASFPLALNGGLGGIEAEAVKAAAAWKTRSFIFFELDSLWLGLFFASSLAATIVLRFKR